MLLRLQVIALGSVLCSSSAAGFPQIKYLSEDPFLRGDLEARQFATTLGPGIWQESNSQSTGSTNSNEVITIIPETSTPQNVDEEVLPQGSLINVGQSENSGGGPQTDNQEGSATTASSVGEGTQSQGSLINANSQTGNEASNTGSNNNQIVASTVSGTQAWYPQVGNVKKDQTKPVSNGIQPDNPNNVNTAPGTQAFYPVASVSLVKEKGSGSAQEPSRPDSAAGSPGVEPVSVLSNQVGVAANQKESDVTKIAGVEPILQEINQNEFDVPNKLRDALEQVGAEPSVHDPLVEQAKTYFMSIWNLEANRLGAPYLEVTDVWPEIGMVYMPTINQMSSKIQNSRPVKEAAERLKSVWEDRKPKEEESATNGGHALSVLSEFFGSWSLEPEEGSPQFDIKDTPIFPIEPVVIFPPKIPPISGDSAFLSSNPTRNSPLAGQRPIHDFNLGSPLEVHEPFPITSARQRRKE